jgi:hypothetical protein
MNTTSKQIRKSVLSLQAAPTQKKSGQNSILQAFQQQVSRPSGRPLGEISNFTSVLTQKKSSIQKKSQIPTVDKSFAEDIEPKTTNYVNTFGTHVAYVST